MPKILMKEKKNMNIKRAKQEIKDSIEAYLTKDNYGEYKIPSIRQRPILLMALRELENTDHGTDRKRM